MIKRAVLAVAWSLAMGVVSAADLMEAYRLAGQYDPAMQAARATRDANREAEPIARAGLLPYLALTGEAAFVDRDIKDSVQGSSDESFTTGDAALQLIQPLYRKDRLVELEQAKDLVEQADFDLSTAEQDLILRVAGAYFGVLSARDTLTFTNAQKRAIERQLDQARQRFDVGLIAITGVHEAQARYDQARADEISAQNALDNAIEALLEITRDPVLPLAELARDIPLNRPEPASLDEWSETALRNNPSIQSARLNAEIARKQIELQDAGDSPAVDLVGAYSVARSDSDVGTDVNTGTIGVQLNLPLYTGGGVQAATRQARFQYRAALDLLEQRRRAVQTQVRDAYRGVESSISRVEALAATVVSAQSALEATEAGFEVGTRTMVDVLDSQRDLYRAKRDYALARYDYIVNTLSLFQAAGTVAPADIETVNAWLNLE